MSHNLTRVECIALPPNVHSQGIMLSEDLFGMKFSLPMLEMQMVIIFIVTQVVYSILKKFQISNFNCQILVCAAAFFNY
jgi:hypothetical protein